MAREKSIALELLAEVKKDRHRRERRQAMRQDMIELNVLRTFSAAMNEQVERDKIVEAASVYLPRLFDYAVLSILLGGDDKPELFVFPTDGASAALVKASVLSLLDTHNALSGASLSADETHRLVAKSTRGLGVKTQRGGDFPRSEITLPLASGGEQLGCLSIASKKTEAFGALGVQLLSLVSYQLSAALRNALLLQQTRELAIRDSLTGLFNRRHFSERMAEECRRAVRYRHPMSLVICDIDHFKEINDKFGHPVGDQVLKAVTLALLEGLRTTDILCRYGGEEFAVILPDATVEEGVLVAERMRVLVEDRTKNLEPLRSSVHISLGVAGIWSGKHLLKPEALVDKADTALYLAKREGRNRVCAAFADGSVKHSSELVGIEKRRFPRISKRLPLKYLVIPELGDASLSGSSLDLSEQGIRLQVDQPMPEGSFVFLEIGHQSAKDSSVRLLSKVMWTSPGEDGKTNVGARIVSTDPASDAELDHLLRGVNKRARHPPRMKK